MKILRSILAVFYICKMTARRIFLFLRKWQGASFEIVCPCSMLPALVSAMCGLLILGSAQWLTKLCDTTELTQNKSAISGIVSFLMYDWEGEDLAQGASLHGEGSEGDIIWHQANIHASLQIYLHHITLTTLPIL